MGSCAAQTFDNISPAKWLSLQTRAAENNIDLTGDTGQTSREGFTFSWEYDSSTARLKIQCLEHPFWAPCSSVNGRIHDLVDAN
jgi:hypothetical protein